MVAAFDDVLARAADEDVASAQADQEVVPAEPEDEVVAGGAVEDVVAVRAVDDLIDLTNPSRAARAAYSGGTPSSVVLGTVTAGADDTTVNRASANAAESATPQ